MKILWFEIRKAVETLKWKLRRGWSLSSFWSAPETTFDLFFKYYRKNIDIFWCVREISQTVWKWWLIFKNENGDVVKNEKLKTILKRNGWFTLFKRTLVKHMSVTWNAFILKQRNWMWWIYWLQLLDPRTIRIVVNEYWEVLKYHQVANWSTLSFAPEDILHCFDELDSDNEVFWQSPMEWIVIDVLADDEAMLTNYYYFKNNAVPSQLIILEEWISPEEQEILIEWLKKDFTWWKWKHKMAISNWIKDIKNIQWSINEMSFEVLRKLTTNKVCVAFSVPKTIIWYTDGVNYTNWDTQYIKFIENTIIPREEKIASRLNEIFYDEYKLTIEFDSDHINDFDKRVDIAVKQIDRWLITVNEWRQQLWYSPHTWIDNADKPLMTKSLDLLEDAWLSDTPISNGWT